jgi:hypothetical protein
MLNNFHQPYRTMTFIIGCIHPKPENESYDGLYLKESEFDKISKELIDKPLLYNHDHDSKIGKVIHVWKMKGKNNTTELFTLCEIDDSCLDGNLAKYAIQNGILKDFSLGHTVKVEQSLLSSKVIEKSAVEVSVCTRGARKNTHIYAISYIPKKKILDEKYIKIDAVASTDDKMSDEVQPPAPAITEANEQQQEEQQQQQQQQQQVVEEEPVQLTHSLLQQLKKLQEDKKILFDELSKYKETSKKQRVEAFNNGINDYIQNLLEKNPELEQYKNEIHSLTEKLIESDNATPLVKLLQAAASKSKDSVVELEKRYQEQKKKDEMISKLTKELNLFKKEAFLLPNERMTTLSAVASETPPKKQKTGLNNDLFSEIEQALRTTSSMSVPKFEVQMRKDRFSDLL